MMVSNPSPVEGHPTTPVLAVRDLKVAFRGRRGRTTTVVEGVNFSLTRSSTYGLVGESGSGKSMTALALMGLLRRNRRATVSGSVTLENRELLTLGTRELSRVRGARMGMVFQDPMSSLDPSYTLGDQVTESIRLHLGLNRRQADQRAIELLRMVEIPAASKRLKAYPHEFSGGMRQRVMIAIALACDPAVLLADEPTTALDVTVQAQILALLRRLQDELGMAILFITHDLAVLAEIADSVGVMYGGQLMEEASCYQVFENVQHPYTEALLRASPEFLELQDAEDTGTSRGAAATGCRYRNRCPYAIEDCKEPVSIEPVNGSDHRARCIRKNDIQLASAVDLWHEANDGAGPDSPERMSV